jgi:hypothetical protein
MTRASRYAPARPFGNILVSLLAQLILLGSLIATGKAQQKQGESEDQFIAEHRQATRKTPEGVSFTLRVRGDKTQFRPGEIISVEFSFTSDLPNSYDLDGATYDRGGRLQLDKFFLDHKKGVVDPLRDYVPGAGGGISSNPTLSESPHTMAFDLNEWLRFDQPGKFRLYVTAPRVLKKGGGGFRNGAEVTSNIVEFEVLPRDDEWADQELQSIKRLLDSSDPKQDRRPVCRRLRFLNTEAAAGEMIRRFGAPLDVCGYEYSMGLIGSPHRAFIVKEMERALEAPDQPISNGYLSALSHLGASLRQNDQLPSPTVRPSDDQQAKAAAEAWRKWGDSRQELQVKYTERLISALPRKQGKARAISVNTLLEMLWNNRSQSARQGSIDKGRAGGADPEIIKKLASEIITVFDDLPIDTQNGLLGYRWKQLAGPAMLAIVRRIFSANPADISSNEGIRLRNLALRRLYELAPDEGRKLILEELRRPNPSVNTDTLGLLPDETLPDLDETLVENLETRKGDLFVLSKLIERYATASVSSRVRAFYGDKAGNWACSIQSSLLAYFLRVDSAMGIELVERELAARGDGYTRCYSSLLVDVAKLRTTPGLEALAIERLDDPDPEVVINAASMLGQYGSAEAENPLWQRLEKWLHEWKGRAEELPKNFDSNHPKFWHKQVRQTLRQALSQSPAWLIDREKLERLRRSSLDKDELQQLNYQAGDLSGDIRVSFQPGHDGWGNSQVAHYQCNSLSALKSKLSQFPKNTTFTWSSYGQDQSAAEQVFSEVKAFLEGKGMKLEKRKGQ